MNEQMTPDELATYLYEMERQAVSFRSSDLSDEQADDDRYRDRHPNSVRHVHRYRDRHPNSVRHVYEV